MQGENKLIQTYKSYLAKKFKSQDKKKIAGSLYIVFSLFALSVFGIFAISPSLSTVSNLQKQYDDNKIVLNALRTKGQALGSLYQEYTSLSPDLFYVDSAIPPNPKIPLLTRQIETLVGSYNLTLKNLDFGTIELYPLGNNNSSIYSFNFNLQVEGDGIAVSNFVSDFIDFSRLISVDRMSFSKTGDDFSTANIVGKAYFYDSKN